MFALMRLGAIPVLAPTAHRETEIAHLVAESEAVGYVGPAVHRGFDHAETAARIAARSTSLRRIFTLTAPGEQTGGFSLLPGGAARRHRRGSSAAPTTTTPTNSAPRPSRSLPAPRTCTWRRCPPSPP
ncbi:hypothetical protein ACWET9_04015 [Streptomyces sp. NPDC004059]